MAASSMEDTFGPKPSTIHNLPALTSNVLIDLESSLVAELSEH